MLRVRMNQACAMPPDLGHVATRDSQQACRRAICRANRTSFTRLNEEMLAGHDYDNSQAKSARHIPIHPLLALGGSLRACILLVRLAWAIMIGCLISLPRL